MNNAFIGVTDELPDEKTMRDISQTRLVLILGTLIATVGTVGSLWLGSMGFEPCELCWYQRILLYPLVIVLGTAALENRPTVYRSAIPFAVLGFGVAGYHSWLQFSASTSSCTVGAISCSSVQLRVLGLTIPNLSMLTFATLAGLLGYVARTSE